MEALSWSSRDLALVADVLCDPWADKERLRDQISSPRLKGERFTPPFCHRLSGCPLANPPIFACFVPPVLGTGTASQKIKESQTRRVENWELRSHM